MTHTSPFMLADRNRQEKQNNTLIPKTADKANDNNKRTNNIMKPDILTVCILATTILASTRHVIGFLTSQTAAASPVVGPPSFAEQKSTRHLSARAAGVGGGDDRDEDVVLQPRRHLDALERNVYDPGDGESPRWLNGVAFCCHCGCVCEWVCRAWHGIWLRWWVRSPWLRRLCFYAFSGLKLHQHETIESA